MKKLKIEDAIGKTLCHDISAMRDGFKGAAFKRGHVITKEDIPAFLDLGKHTVFVWEDHAGEVHEEDAALRMAAMAPVEGAHYTAPSEGKVLLIADTRGMFRVDTALQKEINSIGDITISSPSRPLSGGAWGRLASMRIVPLVTREEQILKAEELCKGRKLLDLRPYNHLKVGVIITGSEVYSGRIKDKFEPVVREKLSQYPCDILGITLCDDDGYDHGRVPPVHRSGADLLIYSGGMSVDPDDVTPTAISSLGADIVKYGLPAQPGNMTLVAYLGNIALLGVPGAAISLPTTMFDVLLPQVFAGDKLTRNDLINLAEGAFASCAKTVISPTAPLAGTEMKDGFGRQISYLRVSVTDKCDLRCRYCMPEEGVIKKQHADMMTEDETIDAIRAPQRLASPRSASPVGNLWSKEHPVLCKRAADVRGITELCLTTNGTALSRLAQPLRDAGVHRINLSLDTLNPEKYAYMTRNGRLDEALAGLQAALDAGFSQVKINAVLIGGFNEDEIPALAALSVDQPIDVRFIELMPMYDSGEFGADAFIPASRVLEALPQALPEEPDGGVARLYRLPGAKGRIGLISPVNEHFCGQCNRLRLTADGKIKPCLHSNQEYSIKGMNFDEIKQQFIRAVSAKPAQHEELSRDKRSQAGRNMNQIGG